MPMSTLAAWRLNSFLKSHHHAGHSSQALALVVLRRNRGRQLKLIPRRFLQRCEVTPHSVERPAADVAEEREGPERSWKCGDVMAEGCNWAGSAFEREAAAAVEAVQRACLLCLSVQSRMVGAGDSRGDEKKESSNSSGGGRSSRGQRGEGVASGVISVLKEDRTPVTVADFGVQVLISLELQSKFPLIPLLGEEDSGALKQGGSSGSSSSSGNGSGSGSAASPLAELVAAEVNRVKSRGVAVLDGSSVVAAIKRNESAISGIERSSGGAGEEGQGQGHVDAVAKYWVLDPIDGTKAFLRGGEAQYVIGLALLVDNRVQVAVMGLPNMKLPKSSGAKDLKGLNADSAEQGHVHDRGEDEQTSAMREQEVVNQSNDGEGKSERGFVLVALRGRGLRVIPLVGEGCLGEVEEEGHKDMDGENGRQSGDAGSSSSSVNRAGDVRHGAACVDGVKGWHEAMVCISDHERWEQLPLARSFKGRWRREGKEFAERDGRKDLGRGVGEGGERGEGGISGVCLEDDGGREGRVSETSPLSSGSEQEGDVDFRPMTLPLCCGSLCKYAAVATGQASVFIQHPMADTPLLKVWDHAAGVLCVEEAGGRVTDFFGEPLDIGDGRRGFRPNGGGVVVSNGVLHDDVVERLRKIYS